ncbi:hypothetical protein [Halobacterium salinarum]|uniref:hypothetical protein n=1 Tax=Halobacterium salinarum TaxID=2242 RepID=UPI001F45BA7F|nr:hypothetical protein [Halobacterium salinarum]MCF2164883.1 hypothetical protein [Halobacterium salinarum]MCF2169019.1 hypothetical protein [Halobacterium salinarum]
MKIDLVDSIHQPEHTGENRCEPCTVLNLVVAAVLGSLIARKSRIGGLLSIFVSVGLIYLRGYLIPGTPTLTKQYLPPSILRWFGKDPEPEIAAGFGGVETANSSSADKSISSDSDEESTASNRSTGVGGTVTENAESPSDEQSPTTGDLETYFLENGILEPCADADDLCLTDSFETAWSEEIEPLADTEITTSEVAEAFGVEDDDHQFELVTRDEARLLQFESGQIGQWPSRSALIADIAASRVLRSWVSGWEAYDSQERGQLLNTLRMFLETCPTTGGDVRIREEVVESCCSSHKVIAVTCEETGERLFEHNLANTEI